MSFAYSGSSITFSIKTGFRIHFTQPGKITIHKMAIAQGLRIIICKEDLKFVENERHRKQRAVKEKRVITDPKNRNESAISKVEDFRIIECVSILCLSVSLSLRHVLNEFVCNLFALFSISSCRPPSISYPLPPPYFPSLYTRAPTTRIKLIPARTHASRALCDAAVR
jgi:hypothetical protein